MADNNSSASGTELPRSLTDGEIVTERKLPRRSFLGATGVLLTGATGIVLGATAELHSPQQNDPDKRPADPDKRPEDPDKRDDDAHRKPEDRRKKEDDDHKRHDDPDKRPSDPDRRPADPDKPPDPHRP